jgi:hypothetical protein
MCSSRPGGRGFVTLRQAAVPPVPVLPPIPNVSGVRGLDPARQDPLYVFLFKVFPSP